MRGIAGNGEIDKIRSDLPDHLRSVVNKRRLNVGQVADSAGNTLIRLQDLLPQLRSYVLGLSNDRAGDDLIFNNC